MTATDDLVQLYDASGNPLGAPTSLEALARPFLTSLVGELEGLRVVMVALPGAAVQGKEAFAAGLENLTPELAEAFVLVRAGDRTIYRHSHPLAELLEQGLAERPPSADAPAAAGFSIWPGGKQPELVRRPGSTPLPHADPPVRVGGMVRRVVAEPLPRRAWSDAPRLAVADEPQEPTGGRVRVLLHRAAHDALARTIPFSKEVESGGFLVGVAYDDAEHEGHQIVVIHDAVPALHSGASLMHFTFTSDSFSAIQREIATRGGQRMVGWYHTHLFEASARLGLSTVDVRMHFTTFTFPWQIAGLVNVDTARDPEGRVLRFYSRHEHDRTMVRCPTEVLDERE